MGNPQGLEAEYHGAAEQSPDSTSATTGVNVVGVDALIGMSVEGSLSLFSNIRDRLLGVREGLAVDGRSIVEEVLDGTDICWDKLEDE